MHAKRKPSRPYGSAVKSELVSAEAKILRRIVKLWFAGNYKNAAKAFQIDFVLLWRYMAGERPIGWPMIARMQELASSRYERQRRALDALEWHERQSELLSLRHDLDALPQPPLRFIRHKKKSGLSRSLVQMIC